jgi:uncharacterized protein
VDTKRPLVIYHGPDCADGFCAAWVARKKLPDAEFFPAQYGVEPPAAANDKDRELYVLDFSYPGDVMFRLAALRHERMIVLDHHKTARAALDGLEIQLASNNCGNALTAVFDMGKSGGRLAWEYFFPGQPSPWLVDYTEDRDLWRWALPNSREVSAALASWPKDFGTWDRLADDGVGDMIGDGEAILRYQGRTIDSACANAREVDLDGHKVLAVNATCLFSRLPASWRKGGRSARPGSCGATARRSGRCDPGTAGRTCPRSPGGTGAGGTATPPGLKNDAPSSITA